VPYNARVFQILIASPGDVLQEREAVAEIIHEWNDLNSRDRGLVLLPLRWETHSSPELGLPPQEVINRQVADYSDLVVGVFWTRLGTPTKDAVSGTAEEISRAVTAGKPVMLYFSKTKADLDTVDLDEYKKLREFRESIMPKGLVEQYSSLSEFRDKFSKQLAISIRDLVSHDTVQEQGERSLEAPPLSLALAQNSGDLCPPARLQLDYVLCTDETKIPDYETPFDRSVDPPGPFESVVTTGSSKRNYYRDLVKYYCQQKGYCAVRLAISNSGPEGVRDLYLELRLSGNGKKS
jgi:hypothetical protein